jgi:hypothetical protein
MSDLDVAKSGKLNIQHQVILKPLENPWNGMVDSYNIDNVWKSLENNIPHIVSRFKQFCIEHGLESDQDKLATTSYEYYLAVRDMCQFVDYQTFLSDQTKEGCAGVADLLKWCDLQDDKKTRSEVISSIESYCRLFADLM